MFSKIPHRSLVTFETHARAQPFCTKHKMKNVSTTRCPQHTHSSHAYRETKSCADPMVETIFSGCSPYPHEPLRQEWSWAKKTLALYIGVQKRRPALKARYDRIHLHLAYRFGWHHQSRNSACSSRQEISQNHPVCAVHCGLASRLVLQQVPKVRTPVSPIIWIPLLVAETQFPAPLRLLHATSHLRRSLHADETCAVLPGTAVLKFPDP
jgi:hypothetical protein